MRTAHTFGCHSRVLCFGAVEIEGKTIVLTGSFLAMPRSEAGQRLSELGAIVKGTVSSKTDLVFAGDKAGGKADKALALGVPVHGEAALMAVLSGEAATAEGTTVEDASGFPALADDVSAVDAEAILGAADWSSLDVERDLLPLREALRGLEERDGVTEAHRLATRELRTGGALLRHPDGHQSDELSCHALSPDGRHIAVGSWIGDDYERGGTIQIWELATGRCVNVLDGVFGGVGWPEFARNIQWSADGRVLANEFNTSMVGKWDPFGDRVHPPLADVGVAGRNGASRPVGFALAPDATRVFIHHGEWDQSPETGVWACLAPLRRSNFDPSFRDPEPLWMKKPSAKLVKDLDKAAISPDHSVFSADGTRVWAFGEWWWEDDAGIPRQAGAVCIDVVKRQLSWFVDTPFHSLRDFNRMAISPDETIMALDHGKTLAFIDAATGRQLAETDSPFSAARMRWGMREGTPRLAVVDEEKEGGVRVYDGTEHRYDLPLTPKPSRWDLADGCTWAWSPDGTRAACLNSDNHVVIVALDDEPGNLETFEAPADALGLWWGAGDVLVVGGKQSLVFRDLGTGETLGDFRFAHEVPAERPLWNDTEDLGQRFHPNPTFALDEEYWAAAFTEGVVIAPSDAAAVLDEKLAWSVGRRYAWPFRWGEATVAKDVASCFRLLAKDSKDILAPVQNRTAPAAVAEWPPPNTASVDDLYDLVAESVRGFGQGWTSHVADTLRLAARQRARAGQAEAAESLIALIPPDERGGHTRAQAEIALILAANGNATFARRLHREAVASASSGVDDHELPSVGSAIGAGFAALGEPDAAEAWIARAIEAINPYPNPWQHRLSVCWALLEAGLEDRARAVWNVDEPGSPFHQDSWLAHLVRIGRDDLVREFLYGARKSMYDVIDAFSVFVPMGRSDLLREYFEYDERGDHDSDRESLAEADRNAEPDRPTAADLAELRAAHEELLRTPLARRREDTKRLAWRAAACGHYSAVLDLLRLVPDDDFNHRAGAATRALWIATSGFDGQPW
ncbi:WD40 repeat domain-containing protein [Stackebrandtia nassauensis]|uniref:BRCT domain protein n=1 Tax=Stackebrandtia nassauensis (strain DSM 44728 / CIP 108903 / NRRL B-16338 / NBRC 102104 / LLR-40K-21) TaxID=446470 RepID=D3PV35_STANL|nr:WD40 repeat domain-containing protein [Stackebrandtia nassauensis]ADD41088.1 BRCT domain protein [Stackebrandtia nassauensis DSM 44728]